MTTITKKTTLLKAPQRVTLTNGIFLTGGNVRVDVTHPEAILGWGQEDMNKFPADLVKNGAIWKTGAIFTYNDVSEDATVTALGEVSPTDVITVTVKINPAKTEFDQNDVTCSLTFVE